MADAAARLRAAFDRFFFGWFSADSLGALRLYFGIGLVFYLLSQYRQLIVLDPFGAAFHYTLPIWYFDWLGIERNIPWLIAPVMIAMVACCLLFAFGRWTKPAIIAIILCIFWLKGVRDSFSGDVHHREVPIFALLVLFLVSKCDQVFGIDARRKRLPPIADWEASWPIRAMQVYIAMFYFWALVAKLRVSGLYWFEHGGRIQETLIGRALRDGFDAAGSPVKLELAWDLAQVPDLVFMLGALVFLFELFIPLILFLRDWRWRAVLLTGGVIFHISNKVLMNVQFYLYPFVFFAFFDMAKVHAWLMSKRPRGAAATALPP
jgi:hypothetical protein